MRATLITLTLTAAVACGATLPAWAQNRGTPARADALDLDDKDRALVAKETVKGNKNKQSGKSGSNANCGQVDIGNDSSNKKGSAQIAERQKTVIVTGNVINTANCK